MDYHLVRGLRLKTEPEHKNLYSWAINEVDQQGRQIGADQIPWAWSLYFTATSCELRDSIDIKSKSQIEAAAPAQQSQILVVKLRPGRPGPEVLFSRQTTFSMFGTDRNINNISLEVYPHTDPADHERCSAWGTVSYTTEIDFRDETTEDCVAFYFSVPPETFARYAMKVSQSSVDELVLRVRMVDGFYSEWSPSISTPSVKILTRGDEQKVAMPRDIRFEPPRLGDVGEAELFINRRVEFGKQAHAPEVRDEPTDTATVRAASDSRVSAEVNAPTVRYWKSIRRAAWFIVILLALILITALSKR